MDSIDEDILRTTISGLERGLLVHHIATFNLKTCGVDENVVKVLHNETFSPFDQIPVTKNGRIIGVLERKEEAVCGSVQDNMRLLDDSILVSAEMPLTEFVPLVTAAPYRLVLRGVEIQGIITRSDILKLPVRLFVFALVTHLEMVMADVIRTKCPDEQKWLDYLTPSRQGTLKEKLQSLKHEHLELSMLEFTEFCDKRTIVRRICNLTSKFEDELEEVEKLRNKVAHAGNFAQNGEELRSFVEHLRLAEYWIEQLSKNLRPTPRKKA